LFPAKPSRRSLIIAPSTVTEAVLAQPLLALLRRFDVLGRLDVLVETGLAPLFHAMSEPDEVIETDIGTEQIALLRRLGLSRRVESGSYDCAYILQTSRTAAIAPWMARIPKLISLRGDLIPGTVRQLPVGRPGGRGPSVADRFISLAFPPGDILPSGIPAPRIDSAPDMTEAVARRLDLDVRKPLVLLCPTSELGATSEWPVRHYAELAALIALQWPDVAIGLLGNPGDRAAATQVALMSGESLHNWSGQLDLAQTLAVMKHAAAVVTSESQYMHLAAALGRPHVAIYGAGDPRAQRISGTRRSVMWLGLECSPCLEAHCKYGHMNCVALQMPTQVFASLRRTMRFSATA
jgi:heptosyltransferase-2